MSVLTRLFKKAQRHAGAGDIATLPGSREFIIDAQYMAFLVGFVALFLPIALARISHFAGGCKYDSISHYYYSPYGGAVFIGSLAFIGAFMLAYRGVTARENLLAGIAGLGAFAVAAFPTDGVGCEGMTLRGRAFVGLKADDAGRLTEVIAGDPKAVHELSGFSTTIHFTAAGVVFLILAVFCLFIFTRIIEDQHIDKGALRPAKLLRNRIYIACGLGILAIMAAIGLRAAGVYDWSGWNGANMTFYLEAAMLGLFGFSWMLKGRMGPLGPWVGRWIDDPRDAAARARRRG